MMDAIKGEVFNKAEIKILVVDDRQDNLLSVESILERDGYTIIKALSGRAALKILLHQQDFTLILMDVQMPEMNGFETASLIYQRDKLRHVPIIFITAHDYGEENIFKGYETGGVDYIYKPYNPELLRYKVGVFAELYKKNHQLLQQEKILKAVNRSLEKEIEKGT
jgi:CheY-like chemotaxis protein